MRICKKCGKVLEKDELFCTECGTKAENEITEPNLSAEKEKKYKKKKMLIVAGIVICFLIIGVVVFLFINDGKDNKTEETDEHETEIQSEETEEFDESEYMFPYSDKEYLTDSDVENLSEEELGFARNEIIARHGRIYTDDTYKTYFESKSWYEGTVEPEIFDTNYENELNEIERANIETIEKYEQKFVSAIAEQYYASILKEYQKAEAGGYSGGRGQYPRVNALLLSDNCEEPLYYTLVDLCDDGVPELFIGYFRDGNISDYNIVDLYGYENGSAKQLAITGGFDVTPVGERKVIGGQSVYTICENGFIKEKESIGAANTGFTYYELQENTIELVIQDGAGQDGEKYFTIDFGGLGVEEATQEDYKNMQTKYPKKTELQWYLLEKLEITVEESSFNAEEVYEPILQQYRNQKGQIMTGGDVDLNQNGIDDFTENNPDLNRNIFGNTGEMPEGLSYIMLDIDNNGVPELFIADVATDSTNPYTIYDMYTCSDGKPQRIFDISEMGINAYYTICENGVIVKAEKMGSNIRYSFYGLEADGTQAVFLEGVEIYVGSLYIRLLADGSTEEIDVESCENLLNTYPAKINMDWIKL